jgi:hypothetical protein
MYTIKEGKWKGRRNMKKGSLTPIMATAPIVLRLLSPIAGARGGAKNFKKEEMTLIYVINKYMVGWMSAPRMGRITNAHLPRMEKIRR